MHLFQPVVGGMHRSRPLAGSSAHAPFPAVGGINNVAAIQPAVGGGAVVAAPAVGGLAPAIGAGGGGGCHPGSSGDGTAVDNPAHRHANRTVQCPMFLAEEFGRCTFQPQFLKPFVKLYQQRMASASRWQRRRSGLRIVDSGLGLSYQQGFCSRLLHPARRGRPWDRGP